MRNFFILVLCFLIILSCVPTIGLMYKDEIITKSEQVAAVNVSAKSAAKDNQSAAKTDKVRVMLHESGKIVTVTRRFYILSVLAKEIDIASPVEALKAQAVCINTFLMYTTAHRKENRYDISDDPAVHQSFLTESALRQFWGDAYETNYKRLTAVVDAVGGQYLRYDGMPALAAYHSSNAGMSESAENYWGRAYAYLVPVTSIGDTLCADYRTTVTFKPNTLKKKLSALQNKSFHFSQSPSDWIAQIETTASGTVMSICIGGVELSGKELRKALGLKSSFFTVSYKNNQFVFCVSGYGHGVGLSQEGAKYMAKCGFDYRQILTHYYKGVEIAD